MIKDYSVMGPVELHMYMSYDGLKFGNLAFTNVPKDAVPSLWDEDAMLDVESVEKYDFLQMGFLYNYITTNPGGAIPYKGMRVWSGCAAELGHLIHEPLFECSINNSRGYAVHLDWITSHILTLDGFRNVHIHGHMFPTTTTVSYDLMWLAREEDK